MTTPIERAAKAGAEARRGITARVNDTDLEVAKAIFESIDTDQLADVVKSNMTARNADGFIVIGDSAHIAQAVKAWLTGKDET